MAITAAEKVLIAGGVLNLAYGALLGYPIVVIRAKGAPDRSKGPACSPVPPARSQNQRATLVRHRDRAVRRGEHCTVRPFHCGRETPAAAPVEGRQLCSRTCWR